MKRRLSRLLAALAAGMAATALLTGAVPLPDPAAAVDGIDETLGAWTIAVVAGLAFAETGAFVGLVVPGETAVIVAGAVAGRGTVDLLPLLVAVWLAAAAGDSASYWLGRRHGRGLLVRHGPRLRITPHRLRTVERHFDGAGARTIVFGRFVGLVRAVAPFVAGAAGMPYPRFVVASLAGTAAWSATFVLLGFGFSRSLDRAEGVASLIAVVVVAAVTAWLLAVGLGRRARRSGSWRCSALDRR